MTAVLKIGRSADCNLIANSSKIALISAQVDGCSSVISDGDVFGFISKKTACNLQWLYEPTL